MVSFSSASHYSGEGSAASGGAILADAMGLGKTLSAIALVYCAVQHKLAAKAVVVVSDRGGVAERDEVVRL